MDVKQIIQQFKDKQPKPLYLVHGEEAYYIDVIAEAASKYLLDENEKEFNFTTVYGKDVDTEQLLGQLKQYPMMADFQLVLLKEAQDVKNWEVLEHYFANPVPTTVFVICHKYKKIDGRKKFAQLLKKNAVSFESKKLFENQVDAWVQQFVKSKGFSISAKASLLLVDALGVDLGKIAKEIEKLAIILEKGTEINEVHIEENIGISKDYNQFELVNAIGKRDVPKAYKIIHYFEQNPKAAHISLIIPTLFSFYDKLMRAHFLGIRDAQKFAMTFRLPPFVCKDYIKAMQIYKPKKIAKNITLLHEYDLKSKGFSKGNATDADLLKELIYQLTN